MKKVTLGKTAHNVSIMALGCLPFGTKLTKEQSFEILDYYTSQGGSFLDTSNNYSFWEPNGKGGESETILGQWFRERQNRKDIFLATKVGAYPLDRDAFMNYKGEGNPWVDLTEGLSKKAIFAAVDASLARLGTDYIDLYYAHVDARQNNIEETLGAFEELIKSGKVLNIGCSNYKTWRMVEAKMTSRAHGWTEYCANQLFYTYFQTERGAPIGDQGGDELIDYVRTHRDVTLLGYTPLLWGSYTRPEKYGEIDRLAPYRRPQNEERMRRLKQVAAQCGVSINEVIYAWMMQSDPVVIPLVAVSRMDHLKEDLKAVDLTLSNEQMRTLNAPLN